MKKYLLFSLIILAGITIKAQLSGTYTINGGAATGGTNFNTFTAFKTAIKSAGVSGSVVVNVVPNSGPYNEQISFDSIGGLSSSNRLTIHGNGNLLYHTTDATNKSVLRVNGCPYTTIDSLKIKATSLSDAVGIHVMNGSHRSVVKNCVVDLTTVYSSTSVDVVGIAVNGFAIWTNGAGNTNNVIVEGNVIYGGPDGSCFGIKFTGGGFPATYSHGHKILNNIVYDALYYGIQVEYSDTILVRGNDISRPTLTSGDFGGIGVFAGATNTIVENNLIHNTHDAVTSATNAYGIRLGNSQPSASNANVIRNNILYKFNGSGSDYGLFVFNSDNAKFYNNTISFNNSSATSGNAYGFYHTSAPNSIELLNNIFSITKGGSGTKYAIYINSSASITSNYNVLHLNSLGSGGQYISYWNSTSYQTLTSWQAANSAIFDTNSVAADPSFISISGNNLRPTSSTINDIAKPLALVPFDIVGTARSTTSPDPGAYETSPPPLDAGILSIDSISSACPGTIPVWATLKNIGTDTLKSVTIKWTVNGILQSTITHSTVLTVQQSEAVFLGNLAISNGNTYNIVAYTTNPNSTPDTINSNDTAYIFNYETALSGYYTVGASGNYLNLNMAVDDLVKRGVCGPVFFDVDSASGPFTNQLLISQINGASPSDSIVFEGNGSEIKVNMTSVDFFVVKFDNSAYITMRNFNIEAYASTSLDGGGFYLTNGANHILVHDCLIDMNGMMTSSFNTAGIIAIDGSVSTGVANYNEFRDNTILALGVREGIHLEGLPGVIGLYANIFKNNVIKDFYFSGIYQTMGDSTVIEGNDFSRPNYTNNWTFTGVRMYQASQNTQILKNRIHNPADQMMNYPFNCTGIDLTDCDAPIGKENIIQNNLIYNFNNIGLHIGINTQNSDGLRFYHNTLVFDFNGSQGLTWAISQGQSANNLEIKNNIISITRKGSDERYGYYFITANAGILSDYNDIFIDTTDSKAYFGRISNIKIKTASAWRANSANTNKDKHTVVADPKFVSAISGDFKPNSCAINNMGDSLGIYIDILDSARNLSTPDPGAIEFDVLYRFVQAQPDTTVCLDKFFVLKSDSGFAKYSWSTGGSSQFENLSGSLLGIGDSLIIVTAWDSSGCKSSDEILVTVEDCSDTLSITEISNPLSFDIYPNPSIDLIYISLNSVKNEQSKISILSSQGQIVKTINYPILSGDNKIMVDLGGLPKGYYMVQISTSNESWSKPLVIN